VTDENVKLVYSTDRMVPRENTRREKGVSGVRSGVMQNVVIRLERKGRGGKSVTVVDGLGLPRNALEVLLKRLKSSLGTGGALREPALEIQGDHRDALMGLLQAMGYGPKKSGG